MTKIERQKHACERVGVGLTQWHDKFKLRDPRDLFVSDTGETVKRVRPVPLGDRAVGYFSDEVALIEELRRWRDRMPVTTIPAVRRKKRSKRDHECRDDAGERV